MSSFSGKFELTGGRGPQSGACALSFDKDTLQLVSDGSPVLACDLGDIEVVAPGDCVLDLTFYGGRHLRLQQFAKAFDNLVHDLLDAYRARLVRCLLLDDLEEVSRFTATVEYGSPARSFCGPAELRLYRSNLACLPINATGFQWRLADVDCVQFDADAYAAVVRSRDESLKVTKLAKRTDEFRQRLERAVQEVAQRTASVLHDLFPFVAPDRFADLAAAMKEGHAVSAARLKAIDSKTVQALAANTLDTKLKPYFEHLATLAGESGTFAGFKIVRAEAGGQSSDEDETEAAGSPDAGDDSQGEGEEQPILYWFFFRIAPPAAKQPLFAWEATSASGRATYVFRESVLAERMGAGASADAIAERLARGLAFVNFRREPVYLSDDSLQVQPKFRRYAIAARKLPELADLRKAFFGRAIHTSFEAWQAQLTTLRA